MNDRQPVQGEAVEGSIARTALILFPLAVADLVASFETSMIYAAFKSAIEEFGDPVSTGWLVTSYMLVAAACAPVVGRLGDLFGRRRILIAVIAIAVTGSFVSAMAGTLGGVIVGRAIQGVAVSILPLCFGLLREHLPTSHVPACVGLITAMSAIGTSAGLIGGGYIIDQFEWRAIFWASASFGVGALLLVRTMLPRSRPQTEAGRIDILGGLLFAPAVGMLLLGLSKGSSAGWASAHGLAMLAGGAGLLAFWALYELRHKEPLIDLRLLKNRAILMAYACLILAALGTFQVVHFFTLLFQQPKWTGAGVGLSATMGGVLQLPATISVIVGAPIAGWLCGRYGSRIVVAGGAALCTLAWLGVVMDMDNPGWLVVTLAMAALGTSILYTGVPNVVIAHVARERVSEATGMLTVARALAGAAGAQLLVIALATSTITDPSQGPGSFPTPQAYHFTLLLLAGLSAGAVIAALMMPKAERQMDPDRIGSSPCTH